MRVVLSFSTLVNITGILLVAAEVACAGAEKEDEESRDGFPSEKQRKAPSASVFVIFYY